MTLCLTPEDEPPAEAGGSGEAVNVLPFRRPGAGAVARPRLHLSPPELAGGEMEALEETLRSGWLAPAGPIPKAFETAFEAVSGFGHALATSSGTAALHLGYRVLDVAPGDEVWAPTLTFVATVAPAAQMGARITFLDVSRETWTLDPELLRDALAQAAREGRLPRVVVPVDLYGQCADLDAIVAACDRWGVPVMSDSAESLGAMGRGRAAGQGARLACFSFNGNKIVTAGGGGALVSDDPGLIASARHLGMQAKEAAPHYQHETTGYSYGFSSVLAAVGLVQLRALQARVAARRAVFARYVAALADLPGISFMPEPAWGRSSRWLSVMLIDPERFGADREMARRALDEAGIESRPVWKPLHLQPAFRGARSIGGGIAAGLFERGLCLPSGAMAPGEQARVIEVIRRLARG
ncbi:DegT/DnrJ/EryC1/StrS family aminotransferase [Roseomonas sp. SSH11]|uniref:DegT/DnrJ/EryC1/StrS family aminotransferase n=1 Tax=Pararoseomonas baculiformis TaxID=2820812 RepID=A0ABS4AHU2_9PROT|nr:aminotransferase class I/II-fold pyridoxal phosphate-dependent enzyme [Pararoseomonas baculiformis]MBP0446594.1 DegT/DnrJ/EryC1/StrS family aminotransferase [Pararoseomonas baculiformis]